MTNRGRVDFLNVHGIRHKYINGKLYAINEYTVDGLLACNLVYIGSMSKKDLLTWLGY